MKDHLRWLHCFKKIVCCHNLQLYSLGFPSKGTWQPCFSIFSEKLSWNCAPFLIRPASTSLEFSKRMKNWLNFLKSNLWFRLKRFSEGFWRENMVLELFLLKWILVNFHYHGTVTSTNCQNFKNSNKEAPKNWTSFFKLRSKSVSKLF